MTPLFFTSGGYTTVRTASGQYSFQGTGTPDLLEHLSFIRREQRRMERRAVALEAVLNGAARLDPAAMACASKPLS